jgi:hypothetical protein
MPELLRALYGSMDGAYTSLLPAVNTGSASTVILVLKSLRSLPTLLTYALRRPHLLSITYEMFTSWAGMVQLLRSSPIR